MEDPGSSGGCFICESVNNEIPNNARSLTLHHALALAARAAEV
eukprot:COSAG01_NODE_26940_length_699_cov_0.543333_1_plen_42_part_10